MVIKTGFRDTDEWKRLTAYVGKYKELYREGKSLLGVSFKTCEGTDNYKNESGAKVVICSPHPDDEILFGLLPLRLLKESNASVTNLALTMGSDPARKETRRAELAAACRFLGFNLLLSREPLGFQNVTPQFSQANEDDRDKMIAAMDMLVTGI